MDTVTIDERTLGKLEKLVGDLGKHMYSAAELVAIAILRRGFSEEETVRHLRVLQKKAKEDK